MPTPIKMPALSPTMEEGTLAKWLVKPGDTVSAGDIMAEIETDKATMEFEAVDEGTIASIAVEAGTEGVKVGTVIAILAEEGEDVDEAAAAAPSGDEEPAEEKPAKDGSEDKSEPAKAAPRESAKPARASVETDTKAPAAPKDDSGERIIASPLARRIAEQNGVDLSTITGSGPRGRIVKADVESAEGGSAKSAADTSEPKDKDEAKSSAKAPASDHGAPYEEEKLSNVRKVIARRLTESKQQVPHYYLAVDIRLDALLDLRKQLNAGLEADGVKLSVNDLVIRAAAMALMKVPAANAMWTEEAILEFERADISVAVAIKGGLITPVVRNANGKGLLEISNEVKELAAKARDGSLMPEAYQGGSFTISNLGMYGIKQFEAIINPPQGAILAVGAGQQRPVVKDGALAIATVMSCSLSVDHRVVDGAIGAEFLAAFKLLIEAPITMLL